MISPFLFDIAVVGLGLFLVLVESFDDKGEKKYLGLTAIGGLAVILLLTFFSAGGPSTIPPGVSSWSFYKADATAIFFKQFALLTTIIILVLSIEYRQIVSRYIYGTHREAGLGEFYILPVFTCAGLMWMASAADFIMIFVSLELVTISFYVLVSYMRRNSHSLEAGVKYLILGALSTGFLVYGITWIFGITGETNLDRIGAEIQRLGPEAQVPLLFGFVLVIVSLGFKIAAVPFQMWVPDVYQGAPTPITAFLSVGSKAAGFIVLMRVIEPFLVLPVIRGKVVAILVTMAALTLIYGNLAALPQGNLKRLLAYSSIAHAGYLLVAVASAGARLSAIAVCFYLAGYLLMTLLSFAVMIVVANNSAGDDIADFDGLGTRSPFLAFAMLVAMLSLAGIPFTAGFFGKFLVFEAAVAQQHYWLVAIGVVTVAAGFYYYLKVVRAMYWNQSEQTGEILVAPLTRAVMVALIAGIFLLGIYPQPVFTLLRQLQG